MYANTYYRGSFSVVKRCTEITSNKDWAVKIIDKEKVKNRQEIVQVEIDVLSSVSHPNNILYYSIRLALSH